MAATAFRDIGLGIGGALAGLAALALIPSQVPGQGLGAIRDPTSAAFFPIIAALALTAASAILIVAFLRGRPDGEAREPLVTLRFIGTGALLIVYLAAIRLVGMYVATSLMIVGLSAAFEYRNWALVAGSALLMPFLIWLLFQKVLVIVFPSGVLF
jgi:putative tricarboxylic transport membrane protein